MGTRLEQIEANFLVGIMDEHRHVEHSHVQRPEKFFSELADTACDYFDQRCEAAHVRWCD